MNAHRGIIALSLLLICSTCFADDWFIPRGDWKDTTHNVYMGVMTGYANTGYKTDTFTPKLPAAKEVKTTGSLFGFILGYDFNEYLATELNYIILPKTELKGMLVDATLVDERFTQHLFSWTAKLKFPITQRTDLYAKLGLGRLSRDNIQITDGFLTLKNGSGDSVITGVGGLGAEYQMGNHIKVGASLNGTLRHGTFRPMIYGALNITYIFSS